MQTITININAAIKSHFEQITPHHYNSLNQQVIDKVLTKIDQLLLENEDHSLHTHLSDLKDMIHMVNDHQWSLELSKQSRILDTLEYFLNENDLIPDAIPSIGYLDDCIVIENSKEILTNELRNYLDFSEKRRVYAKNKSFTQNDWQRIKEQESHSRIRNRRHKQSLRIRGW